MIMHEWQPWLEEWNREILARYDPTEHNAFVDPTVTPAVLSSGWMGFPGASEAQLAELELRLGVTLPPSYRSSGRRGRVVGCLLDASSGQG